MTINEDAWDVKWEDAIDVDTLDYDPTPATDHSIPIPPDDPAYIAQQDAEEAKGEAARAAWEAEHTGPDIVQDLPSWLAQREAEDADDAGASDVLDYDPQWEAQLASYTQPVDTSHDDPAAGEDLERGSGYDPKNEPRDELGW